MSTQAINRGINNGRMGAPYGTYHGKATIPDSIVREIRDKYFDDSIPPRELARQYSIPENTIWDWVNYKTRVHC